MEVKFFISAVSSEFDIYRESIRRALTRTNVSVKIQEDFKAGGVPTLIKLDDYIRECDAVVHLVGDACGADASPQALQALVDRYPDLDTRVLGLANHVGPNAKPLTYTQWEAWLALLHRKRLFVAKALATAPRSSRHAHDDTQAARQALHLQALEGEKAYAEIRFDSVDNLGVQLLASPILDLLADAKFAARLAGDEAARDEFIKQEKRAGLPVPLFRYLWGELGTRVDLLGPLADAVRKGDADVEALAATLATPRGDAAEGDLLRDAWRRVKLVRAWEPLAAALGLPLAKWHELAGVVHETDARRHQVPRASHVRELLLWALDLGEWERSQRALIQLLWLGADEAARRSDDAGRASANTVLASIEADPVLKPLLDWARKGPGAPVGPVRLYAELEMTDGQVPRVSKYWIQREHWPGPSTDVKIAGSVGTQLRELAAGVGDLGKRALHIELLAPFIALCAQNDWLHYSLGNLEAMEGLAVEQDFGDERPVVWRWKERLKDTTQALGAQWKARAPGLVSLANERAELVCRFEGDPVKGKAEFHLLGLAFMPPCPADRQRNLKEFQAALLRGDPYMLWPCDESVIVDEAKTKAFKAAVKKCIARKRLQQLPEALHEARQTGKLKHAVLFMDEPDRNPYTPKGHFETPEGTLP